MKKGFFAILAALTVFALVMTGCDNGTTTTTTTTKFNVTFDYNYTGAPAPKVVSVVKDGKLIASDVPSPARTGFEFTGWFDVAAATGGNRLNMDTPITAAKTYYARWETFDPATQVKVTFDYNYTGSPADGLRIVDKNGTITAANFPAAPARTGYLFDGWFTVAAATGGTEFTATTDVGTANQTVYARWSESINVIYNPNGGVGGKTVAVRKGVAFELPVGDVSRAGWILTGFNTLQAGTGTAYLVGAEVTFTANTTLYAQWKRPETIDPVDEIVEEITLGNAWFAVYQFTLPAGKTWADYKNGGLVASYKLTQDMIDNGVGRAFRVMGNFLETGTYSINTGTPQAPNIVTGNYKEVTGDVYTFADTQASGANGAVLAAKGPLIDLYNGVQMAVVAQWQGGATGPYILSHMGGAFPPTPFAPNLASEISKLGVEPAKDEWFTLSYIIDGSMKNGGHAASRLPADDAVGPFYLAIGLPGQDTPTTFQVKNVTLVGTTAGTEDAVGMPLYYKNSNAAAGATPLYRAYNGQFSKGGVDGTKLANWRIVSGENNLIPVEKDLGAAPTLATITFNLNYPGAPAAETLKIITGEKLLAGQLAKPERGGFLCTGWFNQPASTAGPDEPNDSTEITAATVFSANTTIYAQWRPFTANNTPWEIPNPTMGLHGGASGSPSPLASDGFITMMNGAKNAAAGRSNNDSLISFSFEDDALALLSNVPADKIAGFLYVTVEYSVKRTTTEGVTVSLSIKNGVDSWDNTPAALRPADFNGYPDIATATELTATGSFKWPISLFGAPPSGKDMGFSLQANVGGHSDEFELKITKITFSAN